jgi:glycosyltransferase EpsD
MKKVLLTATVQSHIAQFHLPLIELLKSKGFEVHVAAKDNLSSKNGLRLLTPDKIYDIPFERSPLKISNIKAYGQLKDIITKNHYDYIHCNTPMGGFITRLAAKEARKNGSKLIYTAHGFHFYKGAPLKNWLFYYPIEKWLINLTDKLIVITEEDFRFAIKNFKTDVIHIRGVGVNSFRYFPYEKDKINLLRSEFGYSNDQYILLCIGELNKNKNQKTILKAFSYLLGKIQNLRLLVAGNGIYDAKLKDLAVKLNIKDHVDFLGYKTDLEKYINVCDVVISASYREGMPLNIIEGMMCNKPVIASDNRGHKELITNGESGLLFHPNDYELLAKHILNLRNNPDYAKTLASKGTNSINTYKLESVLKDLNKIYMNLI